MAIVNFSDIAAYTDGERIFHPCSIENTSGLHPILWDDIAEDEELICDICGEVI